MDKRVDNEPTWVAKKQCSECINDCKLKNRKGHCKGQVKKEVTNG